MDLAEFLTEGGVLPFMRAADKQEAVAELAAPLAVRFGLDSGVLVGILMAREALGTTAVGDGVAVPHGKVPGLAAPALAVGRSPDGVDFEAPDGEPCRIFFLILAPEGGVGVHLKLLSQIARRAKDPDFRAELLAAPDASRMLQVVTAP